MPDETTIDVLTLTFTGTDESGAALHELRASHVADVLQGIVGLTSDFAKAGAFHDEGPDQAEVLVRPAQPGSFLIEVVRVITENAETARDTYGLPTIGTILWWVTRGMRAEVSNFDHLDNGNVKLTFQDNTVEEVPLWVWQELQKRKRRRKKQLRQIMAPLSDQHVTELSVTSTSDADTPAKPRRTPETFSLTRADYDAARPDDGVSERSRDFDTEGRMSAIDFDDPARWRVKTSDGTRTVKVQDTKFLNQVAQGLAIRPADVFALQIREDVTTKNGRSRTTWTVLSANRLRRAPDDDKSADSDSDSSS